MPLYRPLEDSSRLAFSVTTESDVLDLKTEYKKGVSTSYEYAKDLASFANHLGGTILVGAIEKDGVLLRYKPMKLDDFQRVRDGFSNAATNKCFPKPTHSSTPLGVDGGYILAINVEPSVSSLIGVRVTTSKTHEGKEEAEAFVFPKRVAQHTTFLRPDSFPMHMLPELRRIVILLNAVEKTVPVLLIRETVDPDDAGDDRSYLFLEEINEQTNTVVFRPASEGEEPVNLVVYPLDQIRTVFRRSDDWLVHMGYVPDGNVTTGTARRLQRAIEGTRAEMFKRRR